VIFIWPGFGRAHTGDHGNFFLARDNGQGFIKGWKQALALRNTVYQVTSFDVLKLKNSECNSAANATSAWCQHVSHGFCKDRSFFSGFGLSDDSRNAAVLSCMNLGVGTVLNTTFFHLRSFACLK
jgi:hypothetical protein